MNLMETFRSYVTEHDRRYNKKNPHALAHYAGAIQSARELVGESPDAATVIKALERFFESDFPPLVRLKRERGDS